MPTSAGGTGHCCYSHFPKNSHEQVWRDGQLLAVSVFEPQTMASSDLTPSLTLEEKSNVADRRFMWCTNYELSIARIRWSYATSQYIVLRCSHFLYTRKYLYARCYYSPSMIATTPANPKVVNDTAKLLAAPVYTAAQLPVPVPLAFPLPVALAAVPFQDPCPIADEVAAAFTALLAGHAPELDLAVGRTDTARAGIVDDEDAETEDQGAFDLVLDLAE